MSPLVAGAIGGASINGGMGIVSTAIGNQIAREREKEAREANFKYNEMAAENADARTRALYNDLQSPAALLSQYKEAGLSPSLMFAGGGGQGAQPSSGAQSAGTSGITPTTYGLPNLDMAQTALALAQARKANAEANTEEGTNERGAAEIRKICTQTENLGLKNAYQEFENSLKMLEVSYEASINEDKINNFFKECEYLRYKVRSAAVQADIDEKSENDVLKYLKERALNVAADTILKKSEKELNEAKVTLTAQQVQDLISQIKTREGTLNLSKDQLQKQVEQWGKENGYTERAQNIAIGKAIGDFFNQANANAIKFIDAIIPF